MGTFPHFNSWTQTRGLSINAKLDFLSFYYYVYQGRNVFLLVYMEKGFNAITLKNLFMLNTNLSRNTALSLLYRGFYVALIGFVWGNF